MMSLLKDRTENNSVVEDASQAVLDFARKSYNKIDPIGKLHVIHALDNGQSKTDIAKKYGVLPQTIAYIYKQKETIIKRYTQKYNLLKSVHCVNLDQTLLDWLQTQIQSGNVINEDNLRDKAQEIISSLNEDFGCINDWLLDFQIRHNIVKYTSDIDFDLQAKEEWVKFYKNLDVKNLYIGGVCALLHSVDLDTYMCCKQDTDNYVSLLFVVHSSGIDKRELLVAGNEPVDPYSWVKSFPVDYYYCNNSLINNSVIVRYLKKWDNALESKGKNVWLAMDLPDIFIDKINCRNIKLINLRNVNIFKTILDKVIECFKFNYRALHTRKVACDKNTSITFLDYLHMISLAWYNVSCKYVQQLMFPPEEGSLYFNNNKEDDHDNNHSLSHWCKVNDVPLNLEYDCNILDKFIFFDKHLPILHFEEFDNIDDNEIGVENKNASISLGMEAYQAMKRLSSYLQGENAELFVINSAKHLENHCEYGALLEMHQIITSTKLNGSE